jgi:uncharacterized protein (DUF58 family)
MLQTVIEKMSRYYRRWLSLDNDAAQIPLLDKTDLSKLEHYAHSLSWPLFEFHRPAMHPLLGETLSTHRGRGFEFEENRVYQAGDEPRMLNWRLYARSGELYTKVFTEERRPQVFLVVDRRAAMRFATRRQLKAALVAKIAACYAFQARHQALAVGGLILNQTAQWFDPAMGEDALNTFINTLSSACAPLSFDADQPGLEESLRLLLYRLPAGCFVLLLSDFSDLEPESGLSVLQQLVEMHTVQAIQILDPAEQRLPGGEFLIEDSSSLKPLSMDGRNEIQQNLYTEAFQERQSKLTACFQNCHIPFKVCTTAEELDACMGIVP